MNRALRLVAVAGSVLACNFPVCSQSQAIRPQYYSWEKHPILNNNPSDPAYFEYDDRFCSMVRVTLDTSTTPQQAAAATVTEIEARLAEGSSTIDLQNLAITIQNLGGYMPEGDEDGGWHRPR